MFFFFCVNYLMQRWPHGCRKRHISFRSLSSQNGGDSEESEGVEDSSSSLSSSSSAYGAMTGLATLGFLETAYLTYVKISGGFISCPIGGGSCNDVLQSDYSVVFGKSLYPYGLLHCSIFHKIYQHNVFCLFQTELKNCFLRKIRIEGKIPIYYNNNVKFTRKSCKL